ncbi:MAG: FAD-dependent oxidoreductase [Burkholderiales bacterium]
MLPGCVSSLDTRSVASGPIGSLLTPSAVSVDRVTRTVAGLRPYRRSGFRVEAEGLGEKLVIHNYGHGGAGITLSWGTAEMALELALTQPHRDVAVLGCGAVGLATARLLQEHRFHVQIYARELPPNTTSNIAGALWSPDYVVALERRGGRFSRRLARASRFSHSRFESLVGERYGIRRLPLYLLSGRAGTDLPWSWQLTPELYNAIHLQHEHHRFPHSGAWLAYMMLIEPDPYLRSLLEDFRQAGGRVVVRDFSDRAAVMELSERIVLNCTGLGAKALFADEELVPVKGQLAFLAPQPAIKHMYVAGEHYMFPRTDGVLLGGTHEIDDWSTTSTTAATDHIIQAHHQIALGMRPYGIQAMYV